MLLRDDLRHGRVCQGSVVLESHRTGPANACENRLNGNLAEDSLIDDEDAEGMGQLSDRLGVWRGLTRGKLAA